MLPRPSRWLVTPPPASRSLVTPPLLGGGVSGVRLRWPEARVSGVDGGWLPPLSGVDGKGG